MTPDHARQSHQNAFHSLGGQLHAGNRCDFTSRKPLAVAQPENSYLSLLVFACRNQSQDLVDLLQLNPLAHSVKTVWAYRSRIDLKGLDYRFRLVRAPLHGQGRLVMIVDDIGRDHFQKSVNGIFVPRVEGSQQSVVVFAEFQVGVLDQIVDLRTRGFAPASRRPQYGRSDHGVKAPYELRPRSLIFRASAGPD